MTLAEIRAMVRRRLDAVDSTVFWTDADIDAAIGEVYEEITDATEWREGVITIDLLQERPYYDLRSVVGDRYLSLGGAYNEQTSRWLHPTAPQDLDMGDRRWERVRGEPVRAMLRGLWWLGLWPQSAADSGTVRQHVKLLPDPLELDDDEPGFPSAFHEGLVEGALANLWAQEAETPRALEAWTAYLTYETALNAWVDGRTAVPQVHGYA